MFFKGKNKNRRKLIIDLISIFSSFGRLEMIFLTNTDEERTKFLINYRKIIDVKKTVSGTSNVHMENSKVYTVFETEEEILKKVQKYEIEIISKAIESIKKV